MNTDRLAINWQNFAQVRLQLKFAFIIRLLIKKSLYAGPQDPLRKHPTLRPRLSLPPLIRH